VSLTLLPAERCGHPPRTTLSNEPLIKGLALRRRMVRQALIPTREDLFNDDVFDRRRLFVLFR
jgi:hypothetical protein